MILCVCHQRTIWNELTLTFIQCLVTCIGWDFALCSLFFVSVLFQVPIVQPLSLLVPHQPLPEIINTITFVLCWKIKQEFENDICDWFYDYFIHAHIHATSAEFYQVKMRPCSPFVATVHIQLNMHCMTFCQYLNLKMASK